MPGQSILRAVCSAIILINPPHGRGVFRPLRRPGRCSISHPGSLPPLHPPSSSRLRPLRRPAFLPQILIDVTSSFISLIRDSAAARSPDVPAAFRYASPSAFSSGQQDGAAIIFSTSDLISCFVIIYLLVWIPLSEFHAFLSLQDLAGRKSKTPSSRISAPAVTLIITLIDPAFITPKHIDSCSKIATSSASAKQPHPRLQQSRHARGFSKAGTLAAVTSCRHVNRKHESGCKGERPGEAFNQPDLT